MRPIQPRILNRHSSVQNKGIVAIPVQLRPMQKLVYPPDNTITFERWYYNTYLSSDARERVYLPIQWTALYCNNQFGSCQKTKQLIQVFLNKLDRNKKYYTIVQYDDGIINNISHLDIKVFAMSGPRIDYPLPLLCTPHTYKFPNTQRDIFASFVGRMTHPIRRQMFDQLNCLPGYFLAMDALPIKHYCEILARSKFVLCPRGYGQTSFRIQEAIDYGAIPVYISDEFILPYNLPTFPFGVTMHPNDNIHECLQYIEDGNKHGIINALIEANKSMYTYAGCKQKILEELNTEKNEDTTSISNK